METNKELLKFHQVLTDEQKQEQKDAEQDNINEPKEDDDNKQLIDTDEKIESKKQEHEEEEERLARIRLAHQRRLMRTLEFHTNIQNDPEWCNARDALIYRDETMKGARRIRQIIKAMCVVAGAVWWLKPEVPMAVIAVEGGIASLAQNIGMIPLGIIGIHNYLNYYHEMEKK
eukprot:326116_1